MKIFLSFLFCLIFLFSCDEINKIINPSSDEYVINQTVNKSSNEQVLESSSNIKIIFPAQSLSGNLEIKVKKESSYPSFGISNTKLGNNIFKIVYKGESNFLKPVTISINYDAALIPSGNNAAQSVKGFIYASGNWKLANYNLDETNKKIIISLNSISNPKMQKDSPLLQEGEGEIIIGDGYTTTDTGNQDNLLMKSKVFFTMFSSTLRPNGRYILYNLSSKSNGTVDTAKLIFSGNKFTASYDTQAGLDPTTIDPSQTLEFIYHKFSIEGEIEANNYKIIKSFVISVCRNYEAVGWAETWYDENSSMSLNNLVLTYESSKKDTLIYEVTDASKSSKVTSFSWFLEDKWNKAQYSQGKSDLKSIRVVFINK